MTWHAWNSLYLKNAAFSINRLVSLSFSEIFNAEILSVVQFQMTGGASPAVVVCDEGCDGGCNCCFEEAKNMTPEWQNNAILQPLYAFCVP